jgi:hypothetical protein
MAFNAYGYIEADMSQYQVGKKFKPGALTILAWGNEIILASSQKGSNSFTYEGEPSKVLQILQMCQTTYLRDYSAGTATKHRTEGKCGEEMAAHLYYLLPTTKASGIDLPAQHAVIGTVGKNPDTGLVEMKDPCGPGSIVSHYLSYLGLSNADANSNRSLNGDAATLWIIRNWKYLTETSSQRIIYWRNLLGGWPVRIKCNCVAPSEIFEPMNDRVVKNTG